MKTGWQQRNHIQNRIRNWQQAGLALLLLFFWGCFAFAAEANAVLNVSASVQGSALEQGIQVSASDFSKMVEGESAALPVLVWKTLDKGLSLGTAVLPESQALQGETLFLVVSVRPEAYEFSLHMASESGRPYSLEGWGRHAGLAVAVNASMYLQDNRTSTGYMRQREHINNPKIGKRLGAFFVAGPKKAGLPLADILEAEAVAGTDILSAYEVVAQNYRLMDKNGRLLWPAEGEAHSIAAIAKDKKGNILFILSQQPLTPGRFAAYLRNFIPDLSTVMYVEGGAQAGMYIAFPNAGEKAPGSAVFKGRQSLLYTMGRKEAPLPNVLGASRR